MWVKDPAIAGTDLFTKGSILAIDEKGKATVETTNGVKTQELVLPLSECHMPHPSDDVTAEPDPGSGSLSQPATEIQDGSGEESARA